MFPTFYGDLSCLLLVPQCLACPSLEVAERSAFVRKHSKTTPAEAPGKGLGRCSSSSGRKAYVYFIRSNKPVSPARLCAVSQQMQTEKTMANTFQNHVIW